MKFAFFGGEPLAVPVLKELKSFNLIPDLIICNPDRPTGRKQNLTPPPVKIWAEKEGIEVFQPTSYKNDEAKEKLSESDWDLFVVVAYNFILPAWLLELPEKGTLNLHPSLLPQLRGASPIRTAIKDDLSEAVGVTIMLLDEEMDHGPILDQMHMSIDGENWPMSGPKLDLALAKMGGSLLADVMQAWVNDEISPQEQNHEQATYCGKLTKSDSELEINPHELPTGKKAEEYWRIINAFAGIGDTFFIHNGKRIKIKTANLTDGQTFQILRIIPEGKKEMDFADFLRNYDSTD